MDPSPKTYFIKTFGCQMNVADSERMAALMTDAGYSEADQADEADLILINGCTVREKAVHKALSTLGGYQDFKKRKRPEQTSRKDLERGAAKKTPMIGVGGCVGQLDKASLFKRAPYLDFVFGTDTIDELPEIVSRVAHGEKHVVFADFDRSAKYSTETKVLGDKAQAFVNIMKGCDKYCTYCIVPFTRGKEKSRTISEVLDDVAKLVARGVREVTLLGQNVNSFGKGNPNTQGLEPLELHSPLGKVGPNQGEENFPQLLRALDKDPRLSAIKRIRFTSSHPLDFSDELLECYRPASEGGVARLANHLHLPVQCGSNRILQKMGRHHKIETYIDQMDRLRSFAPDVGLSTDLIVGFPTETEEDFQETLRLLDRVQFDNIYAFAYSQRPGTRAAKLPDDVPEDVKRDRLNRLLSYQLEIAEKRYRSKVGKQFEVLVEAQAKNQNWLKDDAAPTASDVRVWNGRTSCNRVVIFPTSSPRHLVGKFLQIKITDSTSLTLKGEWMESESAQRGDTPLSESKEGPRA